MTQRLASFFFAALALAIMAVPVAGLAQGFRDVGRSADKAVGRVLVPDANGTGSGFILSASQDGRSLFFLTNQHVIEGGGAIYVGFLQDDEPVLYTARVLQTSSVRDLALLRLVPETGRLHDFGTLPVARRALEKGEDIAAMGFPGRSDTTNFGLGDPAFFESTLTTGTVSKVSNGTFDGRNTLEIVQHTAPTNPGNSGGPLIDLCGGVIGLNTAVAALRRGDQTAPQGTNWASSANEISAFLRAQSTPFKTMSGTCDPTSGALPGTIGDGGSGPVAAQDSTGGSRWLYVTLVGVAMLGATGGAIYVMTKRTGATGPKLKAPARDAPALRVEVGPQRFALSTDALQRGVTVGRDAANDITLDIRELSRRHAKLAIADRKLIVTDLGSSNGTSVDGRKIAPNTPVQINTSSDLRLAGARLTLSRGAG